MQHDFGWNLIYLKTDEAENTDFWQIQAVGDEGKCLTVNDSRPILDTCEDGNEYQQWWTRFA